MLAELRHRFPSVPLWRGHATGHWFAVVRRGTTDHLMEAESPAELARWLDTARRREVSRPAQPSALPARLHRSALSSSTSHAEGLPPIPLPVHGRHGPRRRPWWRRLLHALVVMEEL
ncbi:hypothetical protein [Actinomadura roseirufa]|uniref:hypothetical protein n=1 Tax=Actinomadura roseirufa TaxID=2094049 RepID=UPI001041AD07|nr:hypothetical protein [Actinomadura roseirufa]